MCTKPRLSANNVWIDLGVLSNHAVSVPDLGCLSPRALTGIVECNSSVIPRYCMMKPSLLTFVRAITERYSGRRVYWILMTHLILSKCVPMNGCSTLHAIAFRYELVGRRTIHIEISRYSNNVSTTRHPMHILAHLTGWLPSANDLSESIYATFVRLTQRQQ